MAIGASHIVKISPRVISGGSSDLETTGLLLTSGGTASDGSTLHGDLISANHPALVFNLASEVAAFFGETSIEAKFAQQYFSGVTNQQTSVKTLTIGRWIQSDAPAWIRSGVHADLEDLKDIESGSFVIKVNGVETTVQELDFSACTTESDVCSIIQAKLSNTTVTYNSLLDAYIITSTSSGDNFTFSYATVGDTATALGLTEAAGAVLSDGCTTRNALANMTAICNTTQNFVGFTTAWEASENDAKELSAWADIDDDYVYVDWTLNANAKNQQTASTTKGAKLKGLYNCTLFLYGDYKLAAMVLACGASIAWDRINGMKTWAFKQTSGISPLVTTDAEANALEANRYSYYGAFATRNSAFNFLYEGALSSDHYGFIDVLYGSIYLRNSIQRSCMDGFKSVNRAPYNEEGRAFILAWIQDPINACKRCGVIDEGLELSESQKAQILNETDNEDVVRDLTTKGYWIDVEMPAANARANRQSPTVTLMYAYAGAIHRLDSFTVTTVL